MAAAETKISYLLTKRILIDQHPLSFSGQAYLHKLEVALACIMETYEVTSLLAISVLLYIFLRVDLFTLPGALFPIDGFLGH